MAITLWEPTDGVLSRSPILCKAQDLTVTPIEYQLELRIWRGNKLNPPVDAQYTLSRVPDESQGTVFDISEFINDFLSNPSPSSLIGQQFATMTEQQCWVQGEYTAIGIGTSTNLTGSTFLCFGGYGAFQEGVNPVAPALLNATRRVVLSGDNTYILAVSQHLGPIEEIEVTDSMGAVLDTFVNPNTDLNLSQNYINYIDVSPSNYMGESAYNVLVKGAGGTEIDTLDVIIQDECRYESLTVAFVNKNGAWDFMPFNKKNTVEFEVDSEKYLSQILNSPQNTPPTYNTQEPQIKRYNVNAKRSIMLNTDLLLETAYESIEELMMTRQAFIVENNLSVNPKSVGFRRQTLVNRDLITYGINFEYAHLVKSIVR